MLSIVLSNRKVQRSRQFIDPLDYDEILHFHIEQHLWPLPLGLVAIWGQKQGNRLFTPLKIFILYYLENLRLSSESFLSFCHLASAQL